ncbi:MAG: hypothetical protein CL910_04480 [Deltaproteobacteria bacterium]|jgi:hypothetical protein|nr:hypothetical protein [Deltaproteobacteria bacterium]
MSAALLCVGGVALAAASLVLWFRRLNQVALEGRRSLPLAMLGVAGLLSLAALVQGPGLLLGAVSGLTLLASAGFLFLAVLAPQSKQAPVVPVGQPIPDFAALDENGQEFRLSSLVGKPILLKFFRGHW